MDNETVEDFAKYRLAKAKETLNTAEIIYKNVGLKPNFSTF